MAAMSKRLDELHLWLRSNNNKRENLQVLSDSSGFSRPDPKPICEIKADKEIPKASSKSKRRYKLQKRISCEELDERTMKGLCVFCEEPETPGHYLQHMNSCLLMIDSEDHFSDSMVNEIGNEISRDRWLSNSSGCKLEIGKTDNDEDRVPNDSDLIVNDFEEVEKKTVTENKEGEAVTDKKEPMEVDTSEVEHKTESGGRAKEPPKSASDEVHVQSIELVARDQAQEARSDVVFSPGVSVTRVGAIQSQHCISRRANHVWKPGELERVMVIDDVVSLGKHVKLSDCVALPLITPSSSVLQVFSHDNRSVWEPGGFHCVQVQENRVQYEKNKAEGVEFFVQRIAVASEVENQTVTAVVVYDKRSDRVWEPGGLPTKLNMWDWTKKHPRQGDIFEFEADLLEEIIQQDKNPERHSFLQSENFQPFRQNQVFDELEVVESKSSTNPMLGSMLKRYHKRQQVRKLRFSPKPWLFKFKQKLIRLKIRDKEFQIAMPLAPKILKVLHMLNSLVIAEAVAPIYPTVEYLSQFSSKVGIDKEHSSSSLRANQIWDPGGKFFYI